MTDLPPDERNTLRHYIELARRKNEPGKWFSVGTQSDLFKVFDGLADKGLAEKSQLVAMEADGAPTCLFRITDSGRAAV